VVEGRTSALYQNGTGSAHGLFSSELGIRGPELTARKYRTHKRLWAIKAHGLFAFLDIEPLTLFLSPRGRGKGDGIA